MSLKEMIQERVALKKKRPAFKKQDSHKKLKLKYLKRWRKPRGLQSKVRLNKKGYNKKVTRGWGSQKEVKGLHRSGLEMITVKNIADLKNIDKTTQGVLISGVGMKKKNEIVKECHAKGITAINVKDAKSYLENVSKVMQDRKDKKLKLKTKKAEKSKKLEEKAKQKQKEDEQKKSIEDSMTDEEKKLEEKKERDKLLTQSEN